MATKPAADADPAEGIGFNMTPMIDVVFQLIIFLMLANDMSRRDIEDLQLPAALHASPDTALAEKRRVIVNLLAGKEPGGPPTLKVRGVEMDLDQFGRFLGPEADLARGKDRGGPSDLFVLVRADAATRWQDVQWVMQACAAPGIGVHKVQFATHDPRIDGGN